MRGLGGSTLRGGQTVFHGLRMWGQLLRVSLFVAGVSAVAVPVWHIAKNTKEYDWYAAGMVTLAETKLGFGYPRDSGQEVRLREGGYRVVPIGDLARWRWGLAARDRLRDEVYGSARLGGLLSLVAIALLLLWFRYRGGVLNRARRVRGAELVSARELRRRVRPLPRRVADFLSLSPGTPYCIAGVPYPERAETQHTIVRTLRC